MSEATHTPGPWHADADNGFTCGIYAEHESAFHLATVNNGGNDREAMANARLIAAAPDLLTEGERLADLLAAVPDKERLGLPPEVWYVAGRLKGECLKARGEVEG